MKAFVSKPVQILAKLFDGTRESAKEIVEWVKSDPNFKYDSAELREHVAKCGFSTEAVHDTRDTCSLTIYNQFGGKRIVNRGDWLVLHVESEDYSSLSYEELQAHYKEL